MLETTSRYTVCCRASCIQGQTFSKSLLASVGLSHLYYHLYLIANWMHWAKEAEDEYWNWSGELCLYMSGWHKVELLGLPPSVLSKYYVRISAN